MPSKTDFVSTDKCARSGFVISVPKHTISFARLMVNDVRQSRLCIRLVPTIFITKSCAQWRSIKSQTVNGPTNPHPRQLPVGSHHWGLPAPQRAPATGQCGPALPAGPCQVGEPQASLLAAAGPAGDPVGAPSEGQTPPAAVGVGHTHRLHPVAHRAA